MRVAHAQVSAELEAARMNATTEEQRRLALEALASTAQAQAAQAAASLGDRLRQAEQRAAQLEARLGVERGTQQQQAQGAVSGAPKPPDQKEEVEAMFAEMINEGAGPKPPAVPKVEGLPPQYAAALEVAKAEAEASKVAAAAVEAKAEVEAEAFKAQGEALATDAATDAAREEQGQGERAGGSYSANEAAGCAVTLLADGARLELPPLELPGMQVLTTAPFSHRWRSPRRARCLEYSAARRSRRASLDRLRRSACQPSVCWCRARARRWLRRRSWRWSIPVS